ncbi:OB-fold protein [Flavobacterium channae]|uniref:OB-fold protein n=1 Tax=Flavobacterium channae TaxID=2897181 RepID=UPI001E42C532|nr:hypothetical protein [Flavobacterium channae]UGS24508.1 hypothetical protein LOS89_04340 [Flavobacterium channae]
MSKKYFRILISIVFLMLLVATTIFIYAYKEHRNISSEKPDYELKAEQLIKEFDSNIEIANQKYADRTIISYGKITSLDLNNRMIVVDEKIVIEFSILISNQLKIGDFLKFKGRFVGFDELFQELKIDQATVLN